MRHVKNIDTIVPVFYVSDENKKCIEEIEKKLSLIVLNNKKKKRNLQIKSKVRSIYSSLAIEANSLSLNSVERIIDDQLVLGDRKEIQEVRNANELYEHIDEYNWKDENDFLMAHTLLMKYFEDDNGYYRNHGEAVKRGNTIIYTAPQSILLPSLMKSLFQYLNDNDGTIHPLILSSIFHYYFVYIHPFSDGNGRIARFWVSLILTNWNQKFKYIPIEEEMYINQEEYYDSISKCHINGNANAFIEFMLKCIYSSLEKTTQETTQETIFETIRVTKTCKLNENQQKIIHYVKENPNITRNELADKLNITADGVKYNLNKLVKGNIIERVGSTKAGYWKVK